MSSAPEPALRVARELGVVDVIEIVEDDFHQLPARLAGAAIAVLPRVHCAGIPQKLMNYMAAARPTVAFASSSKILRHEEIGLIVQDVESFAAAIVRLADAPDWAARKGAAARAYVMAHHTWTQAAARAEQVYAGLARPQRGVAVEVETATGAAPCARWRR
jgi:glycosyltransferase involved in cell wall biosynthesis